MLNLSLGLPGLHAAVFRSPIARCSSFSQVYLVLQLSMLLKISCIYWIVLIVLVVILPLSSNFHFSTIMVLRCYMPGCTNKGRGKFHKFPMNEETCKKWQYVSRTRNVDTKHLPHSHYRLCEKHFRSDDYLTSCNRSPRLKKNVVPSVLIPLSNPVLEEHSYTKLSISQQEVTEN